MSTFKSRPVAVQKAAAEVFDTVSNLGALQQRIDTLPDEVRQKAENVRFTDDAIFITAAPVGEIRLDVTERVAPERLTLSAANSPVPLSLSINVSPDGETQSSLVGSVDVEIPAMLKPMIGGKMQEVADKLTEMIAALVQA